MREQTLSAAVLILIAASGCSRPIEPRHEPGDHPSSAQPQLLDVSLLQLIATPERFHRKRVRVIGFLHQEYEGNGLYLHKEDYVQGMTRNGVWINVTECGTSVKPVNDQYVIVEAEFNADKKGRHSMWSASINHVTRCEEWRSVKLGARI
jgi:hypothetical protein